jgi:hypothetical protein
VPAVKRKLSEVENEDKVMCKDKGAAQNTFSPHFQSDVSSKKGGDSN